MEHRARSSRSRNLRSSPELARKPKKKLPEIAERLGDTELDLRYRPSPKEILYAANATTATETLAQVFDRNVAAERRARRCLVGSQRDDLEIWFNGKPAASQASAGELRRAAFQLVLAAHVLSTRKDAKAASLLLVDDVDAELDDDRMQLVFRFIHGHGQVLVATAKEDIARRYGDLGIVIRVDGGKFTAAA